MERSRHVSSPASVLLMALMVSVALGGRRDPTVLGGADRLIEEHLRQQQVQVKAEELMKESPEFEFDTEEEVIAVMRCTACKRMVSHVNPIVVGRMSTDEDGFDETEQAVKKLIRDTCALDNLRFDEYMINACQWFLDEHSEMLAEELVKRCDPDAEEYEENLTPKYVCYYRTDICRNTQSLDQLLGGRVLDIEAQEGKKLQDEHQRRAAVSREKRNRRDQQKRERAKLAREKESAARKRKRVQLDGEASAAPPPPPPPRKTAAGGAHMGGAAPQQAAGKPRAHKTKNKKRTPKTEL